MPIAFSFMNVREPVLRIVRQISPSICKRENSLIGHVADDVTATHGDGKQIFMTITFNAIRYKWICNHKIYKFIIRYFYNSIL